VYARKSNDEATRIRPRSPSRQIKRPGSTPSEELTFDERSVQRRRHLGARLTPGLLKLLGALRPRPKSRLI